MRLQSTSSADVAGLICILGSRFINASFLLKTFKMRRLRLSCQFFSFGLLAELTPAVFAVVPVSCDGGLAEVVATGDDSAAPQADGALKLFFTQQTAAGRSTCNAK